MTVCWNGVRERSVAMLAMLHLGIEPALLALLAATGAIPATAGGWVVGAGQLGMSAGALICWRSAAAARRRSALAAALVGTAAALGLAIVPHLGGVLLLRLLLGGAMGLLLARATAAAAQTRPHRAIGIILLGQQLLAMGVMVALPLAAARWGPATALAALAVVPLAAGLLMRHAPRRATHPLPLPASAQVEASAGPWPANLATMALLIAVTLMIWSYVGAVGTLAGVDADAAGFAIAAASLASAPAALLAALTPPRLERWITALACGAAMLAPLLLSPGNGLASYVAAMVLFNAGSTFAMIRFTAWTMEGCSGTRERRSVVLVQCVATAGGAPLGAMAMASGGLPALTAVAASCTAAAILAQLAARYRLEPDRQRWKRSALPPMA